MDMSALLFLLRMTDESSSSSSLPSDNPLLLRSPGFFGSVRHMMSENEFGVFNDYSTFSSDIMTAAEMEIKSWCKSSNISRLVLKVAADLWKKSETGQFPSLVEIVDKFVESSCLCLRGVTFTEQRELIRHFLVNFGRQPSCRETEATIEFKRFHGTFPTREELDTTLSRMDQMLEDPENFHTNDKLHIGCSNLDKIEVEEFNEEKELECYICMESINKGQKIYTLRPCGHRFHATEKDCLDGSTVINWLKKNRTCPCCRVEVKINTGSKQGKDME